MSLRVLTNAVLSALLAPPCAACGGVLDQPVVGAVCDRCWASIAFRQERFSLDAISVAQAIGAYEGTLRDVLHALKYDGRRSIGPQLSRLMAKYGEPVLEGAHAVVPVPLHPRRLRARGFNQAEDLAHHLGVPLVRALRRSKPTRPQVDLPGERRRDNVRDAFELRRQRWIDWAEPRSLRGRIVVVIDDVATTGATLESCARVLKRAGIAEVRALTAARVVSGRR